MVRIPSILLGLLVFCFPVHAGRTQVEHATAESTHLEVTLGAELEISGRLSSAVAVRNVITRYATTRYVAGPIIRIDVGNLTAEVSKSARSLTLEIGSDRRGAIVLLVNAARLDVALEVRAQLPVYVAGPFNETDRPAVIVTPGEVRSIISYF